LDLVIDLALGATKKQTTSAHNKPALSATTGVEEFAQRFIG
jgi:hypothetical protein